MSAAFELADIQKRLATVESSLAAAVREIEILKADQPRKPSCLICQGTGFVAVRDDAGALVRYQQCNHELGDPLFDRGSN